MERVRARHARVLAAAKGFEDDVSAERHAHCDVVSRIEELAASLSSDLDEEREALVTMDRAEVAGVAVDQESA